MSNTENEKPCTGCGLLKPLGEFYAAVNHHDGYMSRCKSCTFQDAAKWHKENPEKARAARSKNYHQDVHRSRALSRVRNAKWREKQRLKGLAKGLRKEGGKDQLDTDP